MTKRKSTVPQNQPAVPTFDPETQREMVVPFDGAHLIKGGASPQVDPNLIMLALPRAIVEKILGGMMSRASVRCYGSTWITGTETSLPLVVAKTLDTHPRDGGAYTWGQAGVSIEEAQTLQTLAQALGYWVKPDAEGVYRPYKGKE